MSARGGARALRVVVVLVALVSASVVVSAAGAAGRDPVTLMIGGDQYDDQDDATPGDGECATPDNNCTLRAAVQEANATDGDVRIVLPEMWTRGPQLAVTNTSGTVSIEGRGRQVSTISGGEDRWILDVAEGAEVVMRDLLVDDTHANFREGVIGNTGTLTVSNVDFWRYNGGVHNTGTATLEGVRFGRDDGHAASGSVRNSGTMTIRRTMFLDTISPAIDNDGDLTIMDGLIRGSRSGDLPAVVNRGSLGFDGGLIAGVRGRHGGAVATVAGTTMLTNLTLSGNEAEEGAALYATDGAEVTLQHVTLADNHASVGAAISNRSSTVRLGYTLVADNDGPACAGNAVTSTGGNLTDDGSCALGGAGDVTVDDALVAPLGSFGGPLHSHALLEGSPAIDVREPSVSSEAEVCRDVSGAPLSVDVRGMNRPLDGDATGAAACDAGSYERLDTRLRGPTRVETAVATSRDLYPGGHATSVVLARADDAGGGADALVGTPLAHRMDAPVLLTGPDSLHPATEAELLRVLQPGGLVHLLGGRTALSSEVRDRVEALGYRTNRIAGATRFQTAIEIARRLGDPDNLLVASGYDFADALVAGPAASLDSVRGAILLTTKDAKHPATERYLAFRPSATLYAIGGSAVNPYAGDADVTVAGQYREDTALKVARYFFETPTAAGLARSDTFPDALVGGRHMAAQAGPLLLTPPDGGVNYASPPFNRVQLYLCETHRSLESLFVYGGHAAVHRPVANHAFAFVGSC